MLTNQQLECIEMLCIGTKKIQDIAKEIGCDRRTISKWKSQNKEFKAELDKRAHDFESGLIEEAQSILKRKLGIALDNIIDIATSTSVKEETRLKANQYLIDRVLGNTTTKIEQSNADSTGKNTNVDIDQLINEVKEENNVIELKEVN